MKGSKEEACWRSLESSFSDCVVKQQQEQRKPVYHRTSPSPALASAPPATSLSAPPCSHLSQDCSLLIAHISFVAILHFFLTTSLGVIHPTFAGSLKRSLKSRQCPPRSALTKAAARHSLTQRKNVAFTQVLQFSMRARKVRATLSLLSSPLVSSFLFVLFGWDLPH